MEFFFEKPDLVHVWMIVALIGCLVKWTVSVMSVVLKPLYWFHIFWPSLMYCRFKHPVFLHTNSSVRHLIPFCLCLAVFCCCDFSLRITLFLFLGLPPCTCDATILQLQQSANPVSASHFTHFLSIALYSSLLSQGI